MLRQSHPTLSKTLLYLLVATGRVTIDFISFTQDLRRWQGAYLVGGREYVAELKRLKQERTARKALYNLQRANYLKARQIGQRLMVSLTPKGATAGLAIRLKTAPPHPKNFYTVVIFDIPETERLVRQQLRLLLRQGGFTKLQQSVWISKLDAYNLIVEFVRRIKIEQWVNVYRAIDFLHLP